MQQKTPSGMQGMSLNGWDCESGNEHHPLTVKKTCEIEAMCLCSLSSRSRTDQTRPCVTEDMGLFVHSISLAQALGCISYIPPYTLTTFLQIAGQG